MSICSCWLQNGMTYFFIMCFRLQCDIKPPPTDCIHQLSPHGGNSDHERQQQRNRGERQLACCWFDPTLAVVFVPFGSISFTDPRWLCRVWSGAARGFVVGRGVRPMAGPIIIVPFPVISTSRATALLTWNKEKEN